jgi:hypothetical protein
MKLGYKSLIIIIAASCMLTGLSHAAQPDKVIDPRDSMKKTKKQSVKKAADAQTQKDRIKNKYYQLKEGMEFTATDIERMKEIIAKQDEYIASTNNKLMEMENLRQKLVPYLNEVVARLEAEVKKDLPFSQEERAKALAGLKETVADPKISMGEKLKKVLEGVRTEMDYGSSVELGMEEIPYKGQKLQVNVLRLGRTALFMRTIDDKEAGVYNGKEWVPVADEYNAEIKKAMENQKRSKSAEFVNLPIRRAAQ